MSQWISYKLSEKYNSECETRWKHHKILNIDPFDQGQNNENKIQ